MHRSIGAGRRVAGIQLSHLNIDIGAVASAVSRADTRLTASEIRDRIREVQRISTDRIETALADIGDDLANGFIKASMAAHAQDALDNVRAFERAARDAGIDPDQFREDFGRLLNGERIDFGEYGISPVQVSGISTLSSDARRLLVTESNEAIRRVAIGAMYDEGGREAPWELSPRHKDVDVCDDLAAGGPYSLRRWPRTPHPYCGCMPGDAL